MNKPEDQMNEKEIKEELRRYIIGLNEDLDPVISDDLDLRSAGYLDSLTVVKMAEHIEEMRGKKLEYRGATSENFSSIESIYDSFFR